MNGDVLRHTYTVTAVTEETDEGHFLVTVHAVVQDGISTGPYTVEWSAVDETVRDAIAGALDHWHRRGRELHPDV